MANLGYTLSDQTVGNILQRHGILPAPARKRTTTRADFIRAHMAVLAGTDFFTVEVLTLRGLVTYYVLFFIHPESRKVEVSGITPHPNERWMKQMARNVTIIMPNEIIKVKTACCYFQPPRKQRIVLTDQSDVRNA